MYNVYTIYIDVRLCTQSDLFINEVLQATREFTEVQYAFVGNEQTLDVKAWRKNDGAA